MIQFDNLNEAVQRWQRRALGDKSSFCTERGDRRENCKTGPKASRGAQASFWRWQRPSKHSHRRFEAGDGTVCEGRGGPPSGLEPGFGFRPSVVWDRPDRFAEFMMGRGVSVKRKKDISPASPSPAQPQLDCPARGGTQVTITGRGFKLPGLSNSVVLYHHGGSLIGQMAGVCNVSSGSLTSIVCQMPSFDLAHWSSTQFEERIEVVVNGQTLDSSGNDLLFTYSRPLTPIVLEVLPESLSFALTNNLTIVGMNFGLLKREVQVMFGNRTCNVWDVNQTHINCQLKRSAMALPPLCTANRDIYNEDCVVKPHNFFQKPTLLVTSRGYAVARNSSYLDTRFEIHSVDPPVGSEEGGSRVTVRGVGFGNKQLTPQLTIAALGTLGDVESWSDTEATELGEGNRTRGDLTEGDGKVVFVTRKLTLNVEKVGTTTTTTMGQNFTIRRLNVLPSEDCNHKAFRAYATPNITAISSISGNEGDMITFTVSMPSGYIDAVSNAVVSVHFGTHVCPHNVTAKTGDDLTIACTVPAFEASTVMIKVRILPLGYARAGAGLDRFTLGKPERRLGDQQGDGLEVCMAMDTSGPRLLKKPQMTESHAEALLSPHAKSVPRGQWTFALYATIMALGICYAMLGPTLLDLTERLQCSGTMASLLFSARAGGYLLGSTVGGPMVDRSPNPALLLLWGTVGSAIGAFCVPFLRHLPIAYISQSLQGLSMGLLDTGGNVLMLTVWRGSTHVNGAVHGFHFLFGLGAFIAPLCVSFVLRHDADAVQAWFVPVATYAPACVALLLLSFQPQPKTAAEDSEAKALPRIVLLTGAFLLTYVGLEVAFGGYVDPFAVQALGQSKVHAAELTSLYWAALSAARLVATLVTPYVNHYRYIQLHLLLAWTSMFAFSFGGVKMIVLSTFLYGFALGPLFPGALLVAEEKLAPEPLDGRAAGFTVACAALGVFVSMSTTLHLGLCSWPFAAARC
ncbi:unnamed protein product [Durusdinium trenchii]|uniref:IPT/TIG domain-containing protein n=1 Tax=Durusdinium trenchii TaxID=1381693 RepID=A0ABP0S224_9DINO